MSFEINNIYIVLGNKLKENSKISTTLRKRLDKCIEKYKKKDLVIVSGGNIAKQKQTEAYVMKNYLMEKGKIPSKYIIKENKSISTIENIENIVGILSEIPNINEIKIISSKQHIPRVKKIIEERIIGKLYKIKYIES